MLEVCVASIPVEIQPVLCCVSAAGAAVACVHLKGRLRLACEDAQHVYACTLQHCLFREACLLLHMGATNEYLEQIPGATVIWCQAS